MAIPHVDLTWNKKSSKAPTMRQCETLPYIKNNQRLSVYWLKLFFFVHNFLRIKIRQLSLFPAEFYFYFSANFKMK